jgi:dephospho-CoA kinase
VASGKSTVAAMFAEHGLVHLDADQFARELTVRPEVLAEIVARFGKQVLLADGSLDRKALASRVFPDAGARKDLEAILHPRVRERLLTEMRAALARGDSVLLDVPLLLENGLIEHCKACVFVDASEASRAARAQARGWDPGELARREANQASLALKKARSTYTIRNEASLHEAAEQVRAVLEQLGHTNASRP